MKNMLSHRTWNFLARNAMGALGSVDSLVAFITQRVIDDNKNRPEDPIYFSRFGCGKSMCEEIAKLAPDKFVVKEYGLSTVVADAYLKEKVNEHIDSNVQRQDCIETCLKIIETVSNTNAESNCYQIANATLNAILATVSE